MSLLAEPLAPRRGGEICARQGTAKVSAVLADFETAPIEEPLRVTLRMLRKLTRARIAESESACNTRIRLCRL
jgi:hypothetical protein